MIAKYKLSSGILLAFFLCSLPQNVYAYLDPGTGSYLLQLLIGGSIGGLYAMKSWRIAVVKKIKRLFSKS